MRAIWVVATMTACDFTPGRVAPGNGGAYEGPDAALDATIDVAIDAPPPNFHVRIEAHIDGRSHLVINGTTVYWHHYQYAAPGREQFVNHPTRFDGVTWMPVWPDVPDAENRDCDCNSSSYETLPIAVPRVAATATVTAITTRRPPSIIQQPLQANDFTLIVELNDIGAGGASWNTVDVDVVLP